MAATRVPITPAVLRWAIDESGHDVDGVAELLKVGPEVIEAWLDGREQPKLGDFKRLAQKLRRPTATFLLPRPPETPRPAVEFRRPTDTRRTKLNPVELRCLREAALVQRTLSWALSELDEAPPDLPRTRPDEDPEAAASAVCRELEITPEVRGRWRDAYAARRGWRTTLENTGMLVFLLGMGEGGVRGFSLKDERAPLLAVNTAWNPEAQVFSLLHEYGHLLMGSNSACLERGAHGKLKEPSDPAERWCERFAAAALLPWQQVEVFMNRELSWSSGRTVSDLDQARLIARKFKVSVSATVLRLIEKGLATWALFEAIPRAFDQKQEVDGPRAGRTRTAIREAEYGSRATQIFLRAMEEELFSRSEVLNYLRVSDDELTNLRASG